MSSHYTYSSNTSYRKTSRSSGDSWLNLLIFYVLPFIIVNSIIFYLVTCRPALSAEVGESKDFRTVDVTISIDSLLPIKDFSVSMDSEPLTAVKHGKSYTVTVSRNGTLELLATNFNGMTTRIYEPIGSLDYTPPTILDAASKNGVLTFRVEDAQAGVDYSSITATDGHNKPVEALSVDHQNGIVKFPLDPGDELNIMIADLSGNQIQTHINCTVNGLTSVSGDDEAEAGLEDLTGSSAAETTRTSGSSASKETSAKSTSVGSTRP